MSFLSRLFGNESKTSDPTRDWPAASGTGPQMNIERRALESFGGPLTLGDRLEAARVLGRPDACEVSGAWTILRYERWGLVLEFEEQQLFSVEFNIRDAESGEAGHVEGIEPRGPDGVRLTARTTRAELLERFGAPEGDHDDANGAQLLYTRAPMVLSYTFNEDGRLMTWKILANI